MVLLWIGTSACGRSSLLASLRSFTVHLCGGAIIECGVGSCDFHWCFIISRGNSDKGDEYSDLIAVCCTPAGVVGWLASVMQTAEISLMSTPWILIGTYFTIALPFMYRAIANSFEAINLHDLMDAAHLLGASATKAFLLIILPNLERLNGVAVLVVLVPIGRSVVRQHLGGHSLRDTANLPIQHASNQRSLHDQPL